MITSDSVMIILIIIICLAFLVAWFLGVYSWFKGVINGYGLWKRLQLINPNLRFNYFIFSNRNKISLFSNPLPNKRYFDTLFSFGNSKKIEIWLDNYFDISEIKILKDSLANEYLSNIIKAHSLFIRCWIIGFSMGMSIFLLFNFNFFN